MRDEKVNISLTYEQAITIICSLEYQITEFREHLRFLNKDSDVFNDVIAKITELRRLVANIQTQIL